MHRFENSSINKTVRNSPISYRVNSKKNPEHGSCSTTCCERCFCKYEYLSLVFSPRFVKSLENRGKVCFNLCLKSVFRDPFSDQSNEEHLKKYDNCVIIITPLSAPLRLMYT